MSENETRKLLREYFDLQKDLDSIKAQRKVIKAVLRSIHGPEVNIGYLAHLYKVDVNV